MPMADVELAEDTVRALAPLARTVDSLRPLAEAGYPLRLAVRDTDDPRRVRTAVAVAAALGLSLSIIDSAAAGGRFDGVVADLLRQHLGPDRSGLPPPDVGLPPAGDGRARPRLADALGVLPAPTPVTTGDGARLRTYALGEPGRPAVVLASACGMPAHLCQPWMRALAAGHRVVTWETRGLFGGGCGEAAFDALATDVAAQAADLLAVMDRHGLDRAHVMGMCGGAVTALRAAADRPERVASLSLWHGDFSGSPGPLTGHQHNLKALLAMAAQSREDAAVVNRALAETALAEVPAEVAHLVAYPYLSDELFYRYCLLTGSTMATDSTGLLSRVAAPTLVVTSEDDHTAHPGGSYRAAAALPRAVLHVEPHGDHISVFGAHPRLRRALAAFLETAAPPPDVRRRGPARGDRRDG